MPPSLVVLRRARTVATIIALDIRRNCSRNFRLRVERGRTIILNGVNWHVERGQRWVILGANGSGKTSLSSALTGCLMPTDGEISVLGRRYGETDWRELRKQIGIVSSAVRQMMADDEPALETIVSGKFAMIDFWGRLMRADRAHALRILRQIECTHLTDGPWRVLSQGERQRVMIGCALMAAHACSFLTSRAQDSIPPRVNISFNFSSASAIERIHRHSCW